MPLVPFLAEIPRSVVEFLVQAALVTFFIGLPLVRAIKEARARKRQLAERRAEAGEAETPQTASDQLAEARRMFEALRRGEMPSEPIAPAPPAPAPAAPPVQRARASDGAMAGSGTLGPLAKAPTEDELETAASEETSDAEHYVRDEEEVEDEEQRARIENARRLAQERSERATFLRLEHEGAAGSRASVAPGDLTSIDESRGTPAARVTKKSATQSSDLLAELGPGRRKRAALRRAMVAAEVLGPPAALRDPGTGPAGLRRSA